MSKKSRREREERERRKEKRFDLKTIWAILSVFLILGLIGMTAFQQMEIRELKEKTLSPDLGELERLRDSVVILRFQREIPETKEIKVKFGLGVVIEENGQKYIVSLYHILSNGGKLNIDFLQKYLKVYLGSGVGKGRELELRTNPRVDLVVYELPKDLNYSPMPIGNSDDLEIGQQVFLIGFPWTDEIIVREGIIGATKSPKETMAFIQKEGNTELGENDIIVLSYIGSPGDSGGPILTFDDGKLKMIGIHKGHRGVRIGEEIAPTMSWGIKINTILSHTRELIKRF